MQRGKNLDRSFFRFVTIHTFDRLTDGQTERQTAFSSLERVCIAYSALKITAKFHWDQFLVTSS